MPHNTRASTTYGFVLGCGLGVEKVGVDVITVLSPSAMPPCTAFGVGMRITVDREDFISSWDPPSRLPLARGRKVSISAVADGDEEDDDDEEDVESVGGGGGGACFADGGEIETLVDGCCSIFVMPAMNRESNR